MQNSDKLQGTWNSLYHSLFWCKENGTGHLNIEKSNACDALGQICKELLALWGSKEGIFTEAFSF